MNELYAWVPWFNEMSRKIALGDGQKLAECAGQIEWGGSDEYVEFLKNRPDIVDPFSFIYTFARRCRGGKNRAALIASTAAVFGLESVFPSDCDDAFYFPSSTQGSPLFRKDDEGNPPLLWELFRSVLEGIDAVADQAFREALEIPNVGPQSLTQTLFLIDGRTFIPYDGRTRPLLPGKAPYEPTWTRYRSAIDELRGQFPGCKLYEINLFAYLAQEDNVAVGRKSYQVSTHVYGEEKGDYWEDFERNSWVYTGGVGPGVGFDADAKTTSSERYPLQDPDRGDLMLVRTGGEGRALAIVWRNDYRDETTDETRLHVVCLNKQRGALGLRRQRGFSHAQAIDKVFRRCAEYQPTFAAVDPLLSSNGLSRGAVLTTLGEYDRLGGDDFLRHYGYARARTRRILHEDKKYDMKAIWRAAFRYMKKGHALTPEDEKFETNSNAVQRHLEELRFVIVHDSGDEVDPPNPQPLNQILYGPPGTGKTWRTVNLALAIIDGTPDGDHDLDRFNRLRFDPDSGNGNIAMVTFHQNFAYEDFVEGIRPVLDADTQGLKYKLHEGLFKRIAEAASKCREARFVLIIDEINRGNIAKIFGELITLIEDSRRTGSVEETRVSLPYSQAEFAVPANLHLIGTMNTADRSIQLLDTALRRRFTFVEMMPDYGGIETIEGVDCAKMLRTMNERITVLLDRERQIGHAYLLNLSGIADLSQRFRDQLFPLLQEYFFDDWSRIKMVLGKSPFIVDQAARDVIDNPDVIDEDRKVFERLPDNDPKWTSPEAYRAIYEEAPKTPEAS